MKQKDDKMEEYLKSWDKKYGASSRVWGGFFCIDDIVKRVPKNALILDVGSGNGKVLVPLAKAGYRIYGLEISRNANKRLKRYLHDTELVEIGHAEVEVIDGDLRALPFLDCVFDAITAYHVIEHMPGEERKKGLGELRRVLKENGFVFIENFSNMDFRILKNRNLNEKYEKNTFQKGDGTICHYYDDEEFREEIENANFRIDKIEKRRSEVRVGKEKYVHEFLFAVARK